MYLLIAETNLQVENYQNCCPEHFLKVWHVIQFGRDELEHFVIRTSLGS